MKAPTILSRSVLTLLPAAALLLPLYPASADLLTWDTNTTTTGIQDGAGTWSGTGGNWFNVTTSTENVAWDNGSNHIAQFGAGGGGTLTVTVNGTVNAGGLNFLGLANITSDYNLSGGTVQLTSGATIGLAETSSGANNFISINSVLNAENLTIRKTDGSAEGYIELSGTNSLTGTLTIASGNGNILLRSINANALGSANTVVVESGSGILLGGANGTYTSAFQIAGNQNGARGALRLDATNLTLSGTITLTDDASINTNNNSGTLSGGVLEASAGKSLQKTGRGTLTITKESSYTGSTIIAPLGGTTGSGTLHLDFSASSAPVTNLLYSNVGTPGALVLTGGTGPAEMRLTGKDGATNSQAFGNLSVSNATQLTLSSGANGALNASLGTISRTGATTTLAITAPANGSITTTQADGFLGAWATYNSPSASGWAQVSGGKIGAFTGDTAYVTGTEIASSSSANLTVSQASTGNVLQGTGTTLLNTLSMTDGSANRTVTVGTGNVLQFNGDGGIQLANGAKNLTVGAAGNAGAVTAGTAANDALFLANHSIASTLTVNSVIQNNTGGALNVVANGSGTTTLTGNNTYTGTTIIASGVLEIQSANALGGTASGTTVIEGAALHLSGGITTAAESLTLNGTVNGAGALRNLSGNNTYTGAISFGSESRINSDAGTLTIDRSGTSAVINMNNATLFLGGAGNIHIVDPINTGGSAPINKDGSGMLILSGNNSSSLTGPININAGTIRIEHGNALGNTTSSTTVSSGGTLELTNNIVTSAEPLTLNGTGVDNGGALRNVSGTNTYAGIITIGSTNPRINADAGSVLNLTNATAAVRSQNNNNKTVTFGGDGTINVSGKLTDQGTGKLSIIKDGAGTLTLSGANTYTGTTAVNGGTLSLDFTSLPDGTSNLISATSALTINGSTLTMTGKSTAAASTNSQTFAGLTLGTATTNSAHSRLVVTSGTNGSANLALGTINRSQNGHTLDITLPANGSISASGTTGAQGLLIDSRANYFSAYATVNGSSWAALSGGNIVSGDSVSGFYTPSTATTLDTNAATLRDTNADIAAGVTLTTLSTDVHLSSLRFHQPQATEIAQDGARTLATGGILVTSAVGANDSTISVGTLRPASTTNGSDLVVFQNNTQGNLNISSVIVDVGGSIALTKTGPGTLVLSGGSTYTGGTRVTGGTLVLQGNNRLSTSSGIQLGGGNESAKLVLAGNQTFGNGSVALATSGTGTDNRIVGGLATISTLAITTGASSQNFRAGFLGGTGTNENNLALTWQPTSDSAVLQLGDANSYAGQTIINRGIIEVGLLTNAGSISSLGTGDFDSASSIIALGGGSGTAVSGIGTLRYTGSTDSTTDRVVTLASSNTFATPTGVIENNGTGTLKFTSAFTNTGTNTAERTLRLTGTNTGDNEIVGISDGEASTTALAKQGVGTWELTGASTYTGPTSISAGTLVVSGSIGGTSALTVSSGATLQLTGSGDIDAGTLALSDNSSLSLEIGASSATTISLSGGATLSGSITLTLALTANPVDNLSFTLIDGGNALSGYTAGARFVYNGLTLNEGDTFNVTNGGFTQEFAISYAGGGGNDVVLSAVPEPGSAMMLLSTSGLLLGLRRFRRRD